MRIGLTGVAAMAVLALGAADAAQAGRKKSKSAVEPSNAVLLQRIQELEAAVRALKNEQAKTTAQAPAEPAQSHTAKSQASAPMIAASSQPEPVPPAPARPTQIATFDPAQVERALERALVTSGATLLGPMQLELEPFIGYANDSTDFPVVIDQGPPVRIGEVRQETSTVFGGVSARLGLPWDMQLEATIPFAVRDVSERLSENNALVGEIDDDVSGLGDVSLSIAKTLMNESAGAPALIARVIWDTDTGKDDVAGDLGTGFNELGGELVFVKSQDPVVFVVRGGYTHAFEKGNVQPGGQFGVSVETLLAVSPNTSLSMGLSYDYQGETEIGNVDLPGSDASSASLLFGGNTILGQGMVLNVGASAGLTEDAPDFTVSMGVSFRVQ